MTLKETFAFISDKTSIIEKQKSGINQKLEAAKNDKAKAEAAKASALEAKDEKGYKAACRAIADAEAGIEFNSICMQGLQKNPMATETEDRKIKAELYQGMKEIYIESVNEIEKALNMIMNATDTALKKLGAIDAMAQTWDTEIMKVHNPFQQPFTKEKSMVLQQHYNNAKARYSILESAKQTDPVFKKGA